MLDGMGMCKTSKVIGSLNIHDGLISVNICIMICFSVPKVSIIMRVLLYLFS